MRHRNFNGLLAILLVTLMITALSVVTTVVATPVEPNPEGVWTSNPSWGTKLRLENTYIGEAWFGASSTGESSEYFVTIPDYMQPIFRVGGTMYDKLVLVSVAAPQSYSWAVELLRGGIAPSAGTLSWVLENATHKFIPQDFSIVLDNASAGIHVNLRAKANQWFSLPTYATLHVDNAVNIVSIENLDPLSGTMGDTLRLNVTVQNTGEYTDNYRVWCDGGVLDPESWTGPVAKDASKSVTLTTKLPGGWDNIVVTAEGSYAKDVDYITAYGTPVIVLKGFDSTFCFTIAGIGPWVQYNKGDNPPVMVARNDIGSGGVAAVGFMDALNKSGGFPWYGDKLDILIDETFQYINPGATKVLWYDGLNCYYNSSLNASFIAKLKALGYTVEGDARPFENLYAGYSLIGATLKENLLAIQDSNVNENLPLQRGDLLYGGDGYNLVLGCGRRDNTSRAEDNNRAYLKFDLTGLSLPTAISSAKLLFEKNKWGDNITVGAYMADDSWGAPYTGPWTEDNLAWENKPIAENNLGYVNFTSLIQYVWYSIDVTGYVQSQFNTDNIVSIMLKSENEGLYLAGRIAASESYAGIYGPFLEITYTGTKIYTKGLENYDILVIGQPQALDYGTVGGDPWKWSDKDIEIIKEFVRDNGKGLLIGDAGAYTGGVYNYCRVHNRLLHELGFGWWFQHDMVLDNDNHAPGNQGYFPRTGPVVGYYDIEVDVEGAHQIGANYTTRTGLDNCRIYKSCSLIPEPTITATVVVQDNEGTEGSVVTVAIPLTNTSGVWDNFELTATDTKGWCGTDNLSTKMIYLGAGASTTVTIAVAIPPATPAGTVDSITVTATSFSGFGSRLTFSGTGKVTVKSRDRAVKVEIVEDSGIAHASVVDILINPSVRYDPLTFTVKVTNEGLLDDKYELEAIVTDVKLSYAHMYPGENWSVKLTPQELFIPGGQEDTEYASLSVTLPEKAWAGDSITIVVIATGTMEHADPSIPKNPDVTDNDSVVAIAGENAAVAIELLPDSLEPQTGAPGSPLAWLLVIKNIGNVPDTFGLTVGEVLRGQTRDRAMQIEWGAGLVVNTFDLDPGEKGTTYLEVTVPGDAKTSEWDTITVTALGVGTGATDIYTVEAHVLEPGPRIAEGVIEIAVEAEVIAIDVWPIQYDFKVMEEADEKSTGDNLFTVRNTGNVDENILVRGTDAQSMPGEPLTTWELVTTAPGPDKYMLRLDPLAMLLSKSGNTAWSNVAPGGEKYFGLTIFTPTVITTSARMWARVKLVAIKA